MTLCAHSAAQRRVNQSSFIRGQCASFAVKCFAWGLSASRWSLNVVHAFDHSQWYKNASINACKNICCVREVPHRDCGPEAVYSHTSTALTTVGILGGRGRVLGSGSRAGDWESVDVGRERFAYLFFSPRSIFTTLLCICAPMNHSQESYVYTTPIYQDTHHLCMHPSSSP